MKIISKILKYKRAILLTVLAMICFTSIMSVGPTYAYLKIIHDDQMVDNNFDVSRQVNPTVSKDYTVNVGDNKVNADDTGYSVYVRATVVASWKKGSEVLGVFPEQGVNYSLALGSRKWVYNNADGYYYYNEILYASESTSELQVHIKMGDKEIKDLMNRLNRIEGQIRGIKRMLEEDAYCIDIINQVSAANCALNSFTKVILANHIKSCVAEDVKEGSEEKLDELVKTLQKLMK